MIPPRISHSCKRCGGRSVVHVMDPRWEFGPEEGPPAMSLEGLIDSFVGTDLAETTAALHVISALVADDLVRARIRKVLPSRASRCRPGSAISTSRR